ncbi:hypothetical protein PLICRDRAFT_143118 [Plicaturopsis crispa FD-325 SS-3]|nr:hypothetical protein PLICRDRAFT_143118 [Plicaturopsis crispa FD-325 SS-3]
MSLSSLLLQPGAAGPSKRTDGIDNDLDALFRSAASKTQPPSGPHENKKRKLKTDATVDAASSKKSKTSTKSKRARLSDEVEPQPAAEVPSVPPPSKTSKKSSGDKKGKRKAKEVSSEVEEGDNPDLEAAYHDRTSKDTAAAEADDDDDAPDPSKLVHESVAQAKSGRDRGSRNGKTKYVPPDETSEQRDARTIFIGNLSLQVAQKRPLLKQLQRHILAEIPSAKIESTRFRSVPFQTPTSKLPDDGADGADSSNTAVKQPDALEAKKAARSHDRERISTWRQNQADEERLQSDEKKFLNPKEKKRIAFINQEFHTTADTVNAYVVFAHPVPVQEGRPSNLPPPAPAMDPYEAARAAVQKCNGTSFMGRMIRVDHVSKNAKSDAKGLADKSVPTPVVDGDPKLSVFVGNLDFASKEEDLRIFFEGVVSAERGPPGADDGGPKMWVTHVRIVRDKETQMGKGFAYVQFSDRECVDEVLALEETKLKFAKRKLRVQRCKTLPGQVRPAARPSGPTESTPRKAVAAIPKGDPALGEKLAHLPKDERKQVKSTDADRVARRLAKKKARNALAQWGIKPIVKERDRDRVRKPKKTEKNAPVHRKKEARVRSEKSLTKRNAKK